MQPKRHHALIIAWPTLGASVEASLLHEQAPELCRLIEAALPIDTVQEHALITGCMLFAPTRISTLARENVVTFTEMTRGACYFATGSQNIGLVYGEVTEPEGHSVFGHVAERDWPVLEQVGRAVWANTMAPFGGARALLAKRIIPVSFSAR